MDLGFAVLSAPLLLIAPELVSRRLVGHVDRSRDGIKLTVLGVSALAALVLLAKSVV